MIMKFRLKIKTSLRQSHQVIFRKQISNRFLKRTTIFQVLLIFFHLE